MHLYQIFRESPGKYYLLEGNLTKEALASRGLDKDISNCFHKDFFKDKCQAESSAKSDYSNVWVYEVEVTSRTIGTASSLIINSLGAYQYGKYHPPTSQIF